MAVGGINADGNELSTAEVLHLDKTHPSFAKAPELQLPMKLCRMGSFTVHNEMYLTGGYSPNPEGAKSKIYKITCQNEDLKLVTLATSLKHPRFDHVSLPIPENLIEVVRNRWTLEFFEHL